MYLCITCMCVTCSAIVYSVCVICSVGYEFWTPLGLSQCVSQWVWGYTQQLKWLSYFLSLSTSLPPSLPLSLSLQTTLEPRSSTISLQCLVTGILRYMYIRLCGYVTTCTYMYVQCMLLYCSHSQYVVIHANVPLFTCWRNSPMLITSTCMYVHVHVALSLLQ